jgi:hypothetical protein
MYKKLKEEKFSRRALPINMPRSRMRVLARALYRALARDIITDPTSPLTWRPAPR